MDFVISDIETCGFEIHGADLCGTREKEKNQVICLD
jgi:hypothetical protein